MIDPPPIVDGDQLETTETHVRGSLGLNSDAPVPGNGLVQAFARLAGIVADRVNAAANKNFLAFLNLVGISQTPPQAARVPLTFTLAPGSPSDALIAAGAVAAAPSAPGSTNPVLFETERDLLVTRAQLTEVVAVDPARDRLADLRAALTGQGGTGVDPFVGTAALNHRLLIGSDAVALGKNQGLEVTFTSVAGASDWLGAVAWSWWDGTTWQPLSLRASGSPVAGEQIAFGVAGEVPMTTVAGITTRWLCATLGSPLPATDVSVDATTSAITVTSQAPADAAFADADALDISQPFAPFGAGGGASAFAVRADGALGKPGAEVTVRIDLEPGQSPAGEIGLALTWQYWNSTAWANLSVTPTPDVPGFDPSLLLGSGTVSFTVPADASPAAWPASGGATGYWLRIGFQGQARYTAVPLISALTVEFTWAAPRVSGISVTSEIQVGAAHALLPDVALVNGSPVDPTRDFLAFGARPTPGDAMFLACDAAIDASRSHVTATIALTAPLTGSPSASLTWEYWDVSSGEWQALSFVDGTGNLTKNGTVTFAPPSTLGAVAVAGQSHNWLRVRLVSGDYGQDATYTPSGSTFTFTAATLHPPSIASVRFSYTARRVDDAPELLAVEDWVSGSGPQQISAGAPLRDSHGAFNPFTPMSVSEPVVMLGFSEPFANAGIDLYFSSAPSGASQNGNPPQIAWEYSNGMTWQTLAARDDTGGLRSSGLVSFIGPTDLVTAPGLGSTAAWLRARLIADGTRPPLLAVRTNTMWADQLRSVAGETLGSGTGQPSQQYQTTQHPVLEGQILEVLEPESPTGAELAALGPGAVRPAQDATGQAVGAWVTWVEVTDFVASGPRDRNYVIDRVQGVVSFGDGQRGLVPPVGRGNLQITYHAGGGQLGNVPAGTITQLRTTIPFVSAVTNYEPAGGGADVEDLAVAGARGPTALRNRGRAVAAADYEDLALDANSGVARSLTVPATGPADAGSVGLVIVPAHAGPRPTPDGDLLAQVSAYVTQRMSPTVELWVSGPGWLEVSVTAALVPVRAEQASDVQSAALGALSEFLDPLTGGAGHAGWPFGREVHAAELIALLESLGDLDHVAWLEVEQALAKAPPSPGAFLVTSGQHTITMLSPGPTV